MYLVRVNTELKVNGSRLIETVILMLDERGREQN